MGMKKSGMKKLIGAGVVLAAAVAAFFLLGGTGKSEPKYRTAVADKGTVTQTVAAMPRRM